MVKIRGWLSVGLLFAAGAAVITVTEQFRPPANPAPQIVTPSHESVSDYYKQLVTFWSKELKRDPYNFIAARNVASARLALGRATGDEMQYREAETLLRDAARYTPKGDTARPILLARAMMARHGFAQALTIAEKLKQKNPLDREVLELLADAASGLGSYDRAFDTIQTIHALKPDFRSTVRMADMHALQGHRAEALLLLEKAKRIYKGVDPEPAAWIRLRIGIHHLKAGELTDAAKAFEESIAVAPDYYLALEHLAEVHEIRGETEAAAPLLRRAIAINRDPWLLRRLAAIETNEENAAALNNEAEQTIRTRAKKSPPAHARDLAELLLEEGKELDTVLSLVEQDLLVRPGDIKSNLVAAEAYRTAGNLERAAAHLEKAMRLSTPDADLYLEAAALAVAKGDAERAEELKEEAKRLNPYA